MKNLSLLIILLLTWSQAMSQVNFEDKLIYDETASKIRDVRNLNAVDIDNDGDLDVVSVSGGSTRKITWFENLDGQGDYGYVKYVDEVEGRFIIYPIDVNGDGFVDFVISLNNLDSIIWYENLNGEGFERRSIDTEDVSVKNRAVPSDFDGDGDIDILSRSTSNVIWYENIDGQGNFGTYTDIPNTFAGSPIPADLDNDGDIDLIVRDDSIGGTGLFWYENIDGAGTFGVQNIINVFDERSSTVKLADFDGDGDIDLLATITSEQRIHWYENLDGQGTFSSLNVVSNNTPGNFDVGAFDIDMDGDLDILSEENSSIVWFENQDGLGDFGNQQNLIVNLDRGLVCTGDIDQDGDLDLVSSGTSFDKIAWFNNQDGQANFFTMNNINFDLDIDRSVTMADMDNDNLLDLVTGKVWFKALDDRLNFDFNNQRAIGDSDFELFQVLDYEDDGDMDIMGISDQGQMVLYKNSGQGSSFTFEIVLSDLFFDDDFRKFSYDDINNDGFKDITYYSRESETIIHYNLGGTNGYANAQLLVVDQVQVLGDIDNDGFRDILMRNDNSAFLGGEWSINWLRHMDGNGNFGSGNLVENDVWDNGDDCQYYNSYLYLEDLDSDGDLDIIHYGDSSSDNSSGCLYPVFAHYLVWYENLDGLGNYGPQNNLYWQSSFTGWTAFVIPTDMDNDGDIDLFLADRFSTNGISFMMWFENTDGQASFVINEIHNLELTEYQETVERIQKFDIDNNGLPEILYVGQEDVFGGNGDIQIRCLFNTSESLGTDDIRVENDVNIYPIPTTNILNVRSSMAIDRLTVFDISGKQILTETEQSFINVSGLSKGIYLIEIQSESGGSIVKKFIKN